MSKPVWTRENNSDYAEDGSTWTLTVDGDRIGHVESHKVDAGSILVHRYIVESYDVTVYGTDEDEDGLDKEFKVQGRHPQTVLAQAKRFLLSHA